MLIDAYTLTTLQRTGSYDMGYNLILFLKVFSPPWNTASAAQLIQLKCNFQGTVLGAV